MALKNELEVEHLLALIQAPDPSLISVLNDLEAEHGWPHSHLVAGQHVVPFGRWSEVVKAFIQSGVSGLEKLIDKASPKEEYLSFCLAVLEELHNKEAVASTLRILRKHKDQLSEEEIDGITSTFNFLLSFKPEISIPPEEESEIREFLHSRVEHPLETKNLATVYCALRGVGDETSVEILNRAKELDPPWSDTRKIAINAIRKRLKRKMG